MTATPDEVNEDDTFYLYLNDSLDNSAVISYSVQANDGPEEVSAGLCAAAQTARNNSVAPWCYVTVTVDSENNIVITVMPDAPDQNMQLIAYTALEASFPYVNENFTGTHVDRTDYYYSESWQALEERADRVLMGDRATPATTVHVQCLWDLRYIDSPVLRWRDADADTQTGPSGMEETLYFTTDANGNVTSLVGQCDGLVHERYQYDAYGKRTIIGTSSTASWYGNTRGFAGYMMEESSANLYLVRNRAYDCYLGTWLQRDPAGYETSLGSNLYQYVESAPTSHTDCLGLWTGEGLLKAYEAKYGQKQMQALLVLISAGLEIHPECTAWHDWYVDGATTIVIFTNSGWVWEKSNENAAEQLNEALAIHLHLGDTDWIHKAGKIAEGALTLVGGAVGAAAGVALSDTGVGALVGVPLVVLSGATFAEGGAQIGGQVNGILNGTPNDVGENGWNPGQALAGVIGKKLFGEKGEEYATLGYSAIDLGVSLAGGSASIQKILSMKTFTTGMKFVKVRAAGLPALEVGISRHWKLFVAGNTIKAVAAGESVVSGAEFLEKKAATRPQVP